MGQCVESRQSLNMFIPVVKARSGRSAVKKLQRGRTSHRADNIREEDVSSQVGDVNHGVFVARIRHVENYYQAAGL